MKPIPRTLIVVVIISILSITSVGARGRKDDNSRHNVTSQTHRPGSNGTHTSPSHQTLSRPGHNQHIHSVPKRQPQRPHVPVHRPWHRPTPPPPAFRPHPSWRPFKSILGVAIGSTINFTVNALVNNGYTVTGYGNDAIYLGSTPMLGMVWSDATLFYNHGALCASEFIHSTATYNLSRYNTTYRMLTNSYGPPYSSTNNGTVLSSTWWGPGGQFITLNYRPATAANGSPRFFTTLSFGN